MPKNIDLTPIIRIVDDEDEVRSALKLMLECEGWLVRDYPSADSFLRDLDTRTPGCILLDVRMPGLSGPELQEKLVHMGANIPVVFVTSFADIDVAISTLKAGAEDFLLKPVDPDKLLAVIDKAVSLSKLAVAGITLPDKLSATVASLSDQPRRVLGYMREGLNDAVIAERMGLSERTVQVYRAAVYKALGVHSVKQFALLIPALQALDEQR